MVLKKNMTYQRYYLEIARNIDGSRIAEYFR